MKKNGTLLCIGVLVAVLLTTAPAPVFAQADDPDVALSPEALAARKALEAPVRPAPLKGGPTSTHPLFAGNDTTTLPQVLIDPVAGDAVPGFIGVDAWGAAYDEIGNVLYHNDGDALYSWVPGGNAPVLMGTIMDATGAPVTMHGLAFYNGGLYSTSITTDTIYSIDTGTLVATPFITLVDGAASISGIAFDPTTGDLYGTDDGGNDALVLINADGTLTVVAAYLGGETDVDGLAISPARQAYLITDDNTPPEFNVYDLGLGSWVGTVPYPWTGGAVQVAGAWIPGAAGPAPIVCNGATVPFDFGPPADWTVVDTAGLGLKWTNLVGCGETGNFTNGSGGVACVSSANAGGGVDYDTAMISPAFDTTGQSIIQLGFSANYQDSGAGDHFDVDVSTNGGGSWDNVLSWNEDHGTPQGTPGEDVSIEISAVAANQPAVLVRFRYYSLDMGPTDEYVQVDDAFISCDIPVTLQSLTVD